MAYLYVCMYNMYICMYICMYVCVYLYVCMYMTRGSRHPPTGLQFYDETYSSPAAKGFLTGTSYRFLRWLVTSRPSTSIVRFFFSTFPWIYAILLWLAFILIIEERIQDMLCDFWLNRGAEYGLISDRALKSLIPFISVWNRFFSYACDQERKDR